MEGYFFNPYIQGKWATTIPELDAPIPQQAWMGNAINSQWRELKESIKAEKGARCEICGDVNN